MFSLNYCFILWFLQVLLYYCPCKHVFLALCLYSQVLIFLYSLKLLSLSIFYLFIIHSRSLETEETAM